MQYFSHHRLFSTTSSRTPRRSPYRSGPTNICYLIYYYLKKMTYLLHGLVDVALLCKIYYLEMNIHKKFKVILGTYWSNDSHPSGIPILSPIPSGYPTVRHRPLQASRWVGRNRRTWTRPWSGNILFSLWIIECSVYSSSTNFDWPLIVREL